MDSEYEERTVDALLSEAVLIVMSVYLAIALERIFAERERRGEAIAALSALRAELLAAWKGELEEVMAQVDNFLALDGGGA